MNHELSDRDRTIILLRAANQTVPEIAAAIGTGVDVVYRTLRRPEVRVALTEARGEHVRPLLAQVSAEVENTVRKLVELRDAQGMTPPSIIAACKAILDWYKATFDLVDVLPRLAVVEATLEELKGKQPSEQAQEPRTPARPAGD